MKYYIAYCVISIIDINTKKYIFYCRPSDIICMLNDIHLTDIWHLIIKNL